MVDMDISLKELLEIVGACGKTNNSHSFKVGEAYLIRTVTMHYTGRVVNVTDSDVELTDAAWIADTGRFHDALKSGKLQEVEPYVHNVVVSRGCIVDFTLWQHDLPRTQK